LVGAWRGEAAALRGREDPLGRAVVHGIDLCRCEQFLDAARE
jgi:hypothetical protein